MNNSTRNIVKARAGFTLVELIVASTLMTLVLAGVYTTFSTAIRTWRSGEVNYQTYDDARRAFGLLTRELHGIPINALHLLNGTEDTIVFVTLSEPMYVESGWSERLMQVSYRLVDGDRGGKILEREERLVKGPLPLERAGSDTRDLREIELGRSHTFIMAREVEELSFNYMWARRVAHKKEEPPAWAEMLRDTGVKEAVPQGLEIYLTLFDPGTALESQQATFRDVITFRGRTSPIPKHLLQKEDA